MKKHKAKEERREDCMAIRCKTHVLKMYGGCLPTHYIKAAFDNLKDAQVREMGEEVERFMVVDVSKKIVKANYADPDIHKMVAVINPLRVKYGLEPLVKRIKVG